MEFFKRYKFYINRVGEEPISYQEVIQPAIQGPKWFEGLCPFVDKKKRAFDLHPKPIVRTARSCPGMLELFKNSFLVTFPCDLILETHTTGKYSWQKPHQDNQTGTKKAYKPNKIVKKTKEFQKYETWKPK